jgi:antirestriction protein ArdC
MPRQTKKAKDPNAKTGNAATYEKITDNLIALMEAGTVPWHKPWQTHRNVWGRSYRGINIMILDARAQASGFGSNVWITYKQAQKEGGQVMRGEKGTAVVLWKICKRNGKDVEDRSNEENGDGKKRGKTFILAKTFTVFNLDQIAFGDDDDEDEEIRTRLEGQKNDTVADDEATDAMVARYLEDKGPSLSHGGARACYSPSADAVSMPPIKSFDSADHYYATLFHELGHSTGHTSRLNRSEIADMNFFGDHNYSKEELTAEFTSAYLCGVTGRDNGTIADQSAAYLANWLKVLKDDRGMLVTAAQRAQKAADLVLGVQPHKAGEDD